MKTLELEIYAEFLLRVNGTVEYLEWDQRHPIPCYIERSFDLHAFDKYVYALEAEIYILNAFRKEYGSNVKIDFLSMELLCVTDDVLGDIHFFE